MIETEGLARTFGSKEAVHDLTLRVPTGSIFAFLGPNGAGKTTTIRMLMNILRPTRGRATVLGRDSLKLGPAEFERIGHVSENQQMPEWMTVQQLLDYCRPFYPKWDADFCAKLLKQFDLPLKQKIKTLSRGMKMKTALLSSLAYRPQLLVMDEPFTGLDALVRDELIRGVLELSEQENWTVFISSHDIDEVERLADWVGVLNEGRLFLSEPTVELQKRFRQIEVVGEGMQLPDPKPASWMQAEQSGPAIRIVESRFEEGATEKQIRAMFPGAKQVNIQSLSLKEIFLSLARSFKSPRNITVEAGKP